MTSEFPTPPKANGRLENMWIEEGTGGTRGAGLQHMTTDEKKKRSWEGVGIPRESQREKIPIMFEAATTAGRHITTQGRTDDRRIMSTYVEGRVMKTAVTVGSNGYVVGANPVTTNFMVRPGDPGEVSDRTMENLYNYPLNCPDRRQTDEAKKGQAMERKEPAVPKAKTSYLGRLLK
ncbi:hypothetical protein CORC01_04223 [Colletotrichum orchidophilum]|uniref:Uncharacterized protein n=1 Tax=Colletotrichum orchidophilum TaxID=1209926 RepID=A0A1G4BGN7_9PEZI|nr:uncharacterized protein CORC01_04223 [Colletotrichum orchidophilum]OHF00473.1 hypothetical protein CORC01_04223 [Colletotrichum orchidophilum]